MSGLQGPLLLQQEAEVFVGESRFGVRPRPPVPCGAGRPHQISRTNPKHDEQEQTGSIDPTPVVRRKLVKLLWPKLLLCFREKVLSFVRQLRHSILLSLLSLAIPITPQVGRALMKRKISPRVAGAVHNGQAIVLSDMIKMKVQVPLRKIKITV